MVELQQMGKLGIKIDRASSRTLTDQLTDGLRTAGAGRVAKSFETKVPAFEYGRSMAKANQSELRVQNRNGQFGTCNSYSGHDPCPSRDKNR